MDWAVFFKNLTQISLLRWFFVRKIIWILPKKNKIIMRVFVNRHRKSNCLRKKRPSMYGNLPFNFVKKRKRNHHTTIDFFVEIFKNKVKKCMLQVCFCHNIYQSLKKLWTWDYGKFTTFSFKKLLGNYPTLMCLLIKNVKIFLIKIMRALYFSLSYRWWFFF